MRLLMFNHINNTFLLQVDRVDLVNIYFKRSQHKSIAHIDFWVEMPQTRDNTPVFLQVLGCQLTVMCVWGLSVPTRWLKTKLVAREAQDGEAEVAKHFHQCIQSVVLRKQEHKMKMHPIKMTARVMCCEIIWSGCNQSGALPDYYLLYCWPSEGSNIDDEKHLPSVVTERNRLSIQGLSREIIDWFIRHAGTLACVRDCSQSRMSIHSAILLAHLIHWDITHGSAIVQHDWPHCSCGQRWAGTVVSCFNTCMLGRVA